MENIKQILTNVTKLSKSKFQNNTKSSRMRRKREQLMVFPNKLKLFWFYFPFFESITS